jgi:hypothetical protein
MVALCRLLRCVLPQAAVAFGFILVVAGACPARADYFVDFHARGTNQLGHTFVVYGRMDAQSRVIEQHHAGLVPQTDGLAGVLLPVSARIEQEKDDTRLPTVALYRRKVSAADYARVSRLVAYMRRDTRQWSGVFLNCNDFGIQVAETLGLRRPPSLMPPSMWVGMLRLLNDN